MTFDTDKYIQVDADGGLPILTGYNIWWQTFDWWWDMSDPVGYNNKITINLITWLHMKTWLKHRWWQMITDDDRF